MNESSTSAVLTEREGAIAWITLNRPAALNAVDREMRERLPQAIREADSDPDVRVIVVNGAGERAFCAGADVKAFGREGSPAEYRRARLDGHWTDALESAKKPLIAAIHGYCLGGGLEIALACDLRVAAEDASFALPEVSRGTIPGAGGTQRLARIVGLGRALHLILCAERIDAAEALRIGLVTGLVPREALLAEARRIAGVIADHAPIAVMFAKEATRKSLDSDLSTGMKLEADLVSLLVSTEDRKEAGAAFREKRKPVFKGR